MSFAGKAVLVTGSTSGIGEACARLFAESGAAVMVSGRNAARGRRVVDEIGTAGGTARFAAVDLRAEGACERLIDETLDRLGGLDVLVNNAGILYTANALDTTDAQWLDTMAVNVNALFYLSRAAVKHMKTRGRGVIVNVASEWGLNGERNHVALRQQRRGGADHPLHGARSRRRQHPRECSVSGGDSYPHGG